MVLETRAEYKRSLVAFYQTSIKILESANIRIVNHPMGQCYNLIHFTLLYEQRSGFLNQAYQKNINVADCRPSTSYTADFSACYVPESGLEEQLLQ